MFPVSRQDEHCCIGVAADGLTVVSECVDALYAGIVHNALCVNTMLVLRAQEQHACKALIDSTTYNDIQFADNSSRPGAAKP